MTSLTRETVQKRREEAPLGQRVMFRVAALYGLSTHSIPMPLNESESIDSGQVTIMSDPEADPAGNIGIVDFEQGVLRVRYAVQAVFPGLHRLVSERRFSPSLLHPIRAVATDECRLSDDYSGWRAFGCLDFLPGSVWSGATGG